MNTIAIWHTATNAPNTKDTSSPRSLSPSNKYILRHIVLLCSNRATQHPRPTNPGGRHAWGLSRYTKVFHRTPDALTTHLLDLCTTNCNLAQHPCVLKLRCGKQCEYISPNQRQVCKKYCEKCRNHQNQVFGYRKTRHTCVWISPVSGRQSRLCPNKNMLYAISL